MHRLALEIDTLSVESFPVSPAGTEIAHQIINGTYDGCSSICTQSSTYVPPDSVFPYCFPG